MRDIIKLVSTAGTGTFYTTTKNKRTMAEKKSKRNATGKLELKKYDPRAKNEKGGFGAHVLFKEEKIK